MAPAGGRGDGRLSGSPCVASVVHTWHSRCAAGAGHRHRANGVFKSGLSAGVLGQCANRRSAGAARLSCRPRGDRASAAHTAGSVRTHSGQRVGNAAGSRMLRSASVRLVCGACGCDERFPSIPRGRNSSGRKEVIRTGRSELLIVDGDAHPASRTTRAPSHSRLRRFAWR